MINAIRRGAIEFLNFVLPRLCRGCGERILETNTIVCEDCINRLAPLLEPICATCGCPDAKILEPGKCKNCLPGTTWFRRARGCTPFTGIARLLVFRLKYHSRPEYAELMARTMARELTRWTSPGGPWAGDPLDPVSVLLVPVPLHSSRQRHRGFNQAERLARAIARELHFDFANCLQRTRPTQTQTRLKKRARRKNVEGAFSCISADTVAGKRIILIDDVYTTGNTLNECAKELIQAGAASVECLAFGRASLS